ncbi:hypothetical protein ACSBR1_031293 [Camellia fascicularis]
MAMGTFTPPNCIDQSMYPDYYFQIRNMCAYMAPSLDVRQDMAVVEVPKLEKEVVTKAIKECGQLKSKITHLVFCTTSVVDMPNADYQLTKLLGLSLSVKRLMMYQQGCYAGGMVLCLANDLAEVLGSWSCALRSL